jgi:hypothetical protein
MREPEGRSGAGGHGESAGKLLQAPPHPKWMFHQIKLSMMLLDHEKEAALIRQGPIVLAVAANISGEHTCSSRPKYNHINNVMT